jgi:hypothetical protein
VVDTPRRRGVQGDELHARGLPARRAAGNPCCRRAAGPRMPAARAQAAHAPRDPGGRTAPTPRPRPHARAPLNCGSTDRVQRLAQLRGLRWLTPPALPRLPPRATPGSHADRAALRSLAQDRAYSLARSLMMMNPALLRTALLSALLLASAAAAPPPLMLTGCSASESWLCTALVPSPTVSCSGAPVYYSTWTAGWGLLALSYTPDGTWQLVIACSTRAACFRDYSCDALLNSPDCGATPACASVSAYVRTESGADADPLQLVSLGRLSVSALPGVVDGFACAPTNDAAQCAALGEAYAHMGGDSWINNAGWRSAAAGVPTDIFTFHGVTWEVAPVSVPFSACMPYEAQDTDNATSADTTATCSASLPAGYTYTITTCPVTAGTNATLNGNTYLRLIQDSSGAEIAANDDGGSCGYASTISVYTRWALGFDSVNVTIRQGCKGNGYCNAIVTISVSASPVGVQHMCVLARVRVCAHVCLSANRRLTCLR